MEEPEPRVNCQLARIVVQNFPGLATIRPKETDVVLLCCSEFHRGQLLLEEEGRGSSIFNVISKLWATYRQESDQDTDISIGHLTSQRDGHSF